MQTSTEEIVERLRNRAPILGMVAGLSLAYVGLGGLGIGWAALGIAGACVWAALTPIPSPDNADLTGRSSDTIELGQIDDTLIVPLLEGLPDAALVLNARGFVIASNAAARAIAPVTTGRPLSYWSRSPELLSAAESALTSNTQQRCHVRLFTPIERSLDVIVTPAGGNPGKPPTLTLLTCRDLTEQEQLSRMRVEFVANASHELRTPLASLRGFVETLQGAAKNDPAAQARFLGIMQTQAERMSRLVEDLLSLSRIEMREHLAPEGVVDLAAVVAETVATLKAQAEAGNIRLETSVSSDATRVVGDRDELAQVAQNLIQNAIKYGRSGGKVDVALRREANQLLLEVADDGIGIAPEHLPRLTERFYRVSAKDSKDRGGTGLGLAIVKHIVNRHRGDLKITSTPGKGSTFAVALQLAT